MNFKYYNLVRALTVSDFKLRYHGSFLGLFWAFLKPLFLFGVLYTVFSIFVHFPIPHYGLYLLLGIIIWNFFAEATTLSLKNLLQKAPLIRKIYFPPSILIFSSLSIAFLNLGANLFIFAVIALWVGIPISFSILLVFVWIGVLYLFVLGFSFGLSAFNVKLKDVEHLWDIFLPLGLWITPIAYSVDMVSAKYHWVFNLNPMAVIVQNIRTAVLGGPPPSLGSDLSLGIMVTIVCILGYTLFQSQALSFAEEL